MKKSLLLLISVTLLLLAGNQQQGFGQTLLIDNFDYVAGTNLTSNGWTAHSGAGTNAITVNSTGLTFSGFPGSGIGLSALLDNTGEDVHRVFTPVTTGNVYCSFMLNVATVYSDYFFHLGGDPISTIFRGKTFINGTGSNYNIGLSKGSNTPTLTTGAPYSAGTTYIVVLKYSIIDGTTNDEVSMFIFDGSIPAIEPSAPTIGPLADASQSDIVPASVALRQANAAQNFIVDGIRVATTWVDAISDIYPPATTFNPANGAVDVLVNVTPTITFDEAVRKTDGTELVNADLSTLVTFKKTDGSGADVAFTATIDAAKKVITVTPAAALDNSQIYYVAIGPVEDALGNESTLKSVSFTTVSAVTPTVTVTGPAGGEVFHAGDPATITWTSANIENVKIEVWARQDATLWEWITLVASMPAAAGKFDLTIAADAMYGIEYKIRISDVTNSAVNSVSPNFTIIGVATSLTDLRTNFLIGDIVKISSEVTVTFLRPANRNQKYLQDAGAGLLIDDASGVLTTVVAIGDNISGLEGTLGSYGGVLQIVPTVSTVTVVSSGNTVTIPEMTIPQYTANYQNYESMLIKLKDVYFQGADGSATFASSANYTLTDGTNTVTFRTFYAGDGNIVGTVIPVSHLNVTAIAGFFNATIQVYSRTTSDFEVLTGMTDASFKEISMYPVPATSILGVHNMRNVKNIEILDLSGKVVMSVSNGNDDEIQIPVSKLNKGMYFIRFSTTDGKVIKRFIKQ